jgi:hypothetical protein
MDPEPEVPTLLFIGKGGRVTVRAIELTYWISSLLHGMHNRLILAIVQIHLSWLALISTLVDHVSPCWASFLTAARLIAW